MNKHLVIPAALISGLFSLSVHAVPGEYWDITTTMDMPGMGFSMPPTTLRACLPKGAENNPERTSGDKNCKMTDIKTTGNKVVWKARCDHDGEVMTGEGEQTYSSTAFDGKMHMIGKSRGREMEMNMKFSGKHVGGACDSDEQKKKAEAQASQFKGQVCDTSRYHNTAEWISSADMILQPRAVCADQRKQFCAQVAKDAANDTQAYAALLQHDQHMVTNGITIAKECNINMAATTKSVCKKIDADSYEMLAPSCPAEAKAYREVQRRRDCEGRAYTAETRAVDIQNCINGVKSKPVQEKPAAKEESGTTANDVLDAAKKLRSTFSF